MVFLSTMRALSLQTVKFQMRVPSIKFRAGDSTTVNRATGSSASPQVMVKKEQPKKQVKAGPASTTIILQEVPARFQRKSISEEECEYINRGGPA